MSHSRSKEELELLSRAEEMVKAHMSKCVLFTYNPSDTDSQDTTHLTIGLMVSSLPADEPGPYLLPKT
jgi:hypothetical protein